MKLQSKLRRTVILVLCLLLVAGVFASCGKKEEKAKEKNITVTDMAGREVTVPTDAKKFVAIGPGALRLYCYVGDTDKLVGIEDMEKKNSEGRPYLMANKKLEELPTVGAGGPGNAPDSEKLLSVKPDVIFMYNTETSAIDGLQSKTGIPVVALSYGKTEVFDPEVDRSLKLIGQITGKEDRAKEVVDFFAKKKKDLEKRTKDIADKDKPKVYMGGMGNRGAHGIESTTGNFSLFNAIGAKNAVDEAGISDYIMLDKEKLLEMDPDMIFIDGGGMGLFKEDYGKNKAYYQELKAFKEGNVYMHLPYNYYYTNIDVALADAYYMGSIIYPKAFDGVDAKEKFNEITKFLLGAELYDDMAKAYFGGYHKVELE